MAIDASQDQLNKAKTQESQSSMGQSLGGSGNATGATTPVGVGSGRVASYSSGQQPQQGSGRFTNLQKYIGANQGAGEQLGQKVVGNVESGLKKASDTSQASNIRSAVESEKNRLNQGSQFNEQLKQDPMQITNDQENVNKFQALAKNQNQVGNLQSQAQEAQGQQIGQLQSAGQNIQGLGTEQGRFNLLKNTVNQPGYSTGQQRLDQLFLQTQNPNQMVQAQRNLGNQLGQAQENAQNLYTGIGQDLSAAGTQAANVAQQLQGTLGSEQQNLIAGQNTAAQNFQAQQADKNMALETFMKGGYGSLTPDQKTFIDSQLQSGGLAAGQRSYNVLENPNAASQFGTLGDTSATAQQLIGQPEFNRYSALASLAGLNPEQMAFKQVGAGAQQAGIKGQELSNAIQAARTGLENDFNKNYNYTASAQRQIPNQLLTGTAQVNQNLKDLLNQYEAGTTTSGSQLGTTGSLVNQYGGNMMGSYIGPGGNDAFGNSNVDTQRQQAQQQAWQDFMNRLQAGGYNQGLGGVTPTKA